MNNELGIMGLKNKTNFKQGFTLLEVLIATSIFAMIMLITTGVVAQSSSYRSKLTALRQVNEETRRIADQLTRDIRSANSEAKINLGSITSPNIKSYKNGIALFRQTTCEVSGFSGKDNVSPNLNVVLDLNAANTIVIATKDKYKIYMVSTAIFPTLGDGLYYQEIDRENGAHILTREEINTTRSCAGGDQNVTGRINRITPVNMDVFVQSAGFAPDDTSTSSVQPFVQFIVTAQTMDYSTSTDALGKAKAMIRSSVTSRSYPN